MSPSLVFRSKCHRSTFCLYRIWQLTFIASYLGNLTFPKVQTILFLNTLSQTNNLLPFSGKSVLLYFFNPVQFEYLPLTFKATQLQKYVSHLKNNYIFGILASSWLIWLIWKWHSSTFNFWPPYNPMGSFWGPLSQIAQWCQRGISLFLCQDM